MNKPAFRQIHLDFHTSPYIPEIGAEFDPKDFVTKLKEAHVNSITCFAKCHHGMCYYPTKVGKMHPGLKFDLLGEMIEACHKEGIRVPVYITVGWEELSAEEHPEWLQVSREGVLGHKLPFEQAYYKWRRLCLNKIEYENLVIAHIEEVLNLYQPDGLFFDIVVQERCLCNTCLQDMKRMGFNPQREEDVKKHDFAVTQKFMNRIYSFINQKCPQIGVYFNMWYTYAAADSEGYNVKELIKHNTHMELESLPSGEWGYNHFLMNVNYYNVQDKEITGMTGKFHKSWGDFGSLKNLVALEYECFRMIANGAKCSIGDQLHPSGKLDPLVYKRVGQVYKRIEECEPWCVDTKKLTDIGILTSNRDLETQYSADEGAMRMLVELHHPFDIIDLDADFSRYKLLILPDSILINDRTAARLKKFLDNGGKIVLSGKSGLNTEQTGFALRDFGVEYKGEALFAPDYIRLDETFLGWTEPMDYCFYEKGIEVAALEGSRVLANLRAPYFNRSYDKFCSHCQTPPDKLTDSPAIVMNGNVIYISKPLFTDYINSGTKVYRDIIEKSLQILLPHPVIISNLPASAEVSVRKQGDKLILHVLHYIPQRKCRELDVVEECIPIHNISIKVRLERKPDKVYLAPQKSELSFNFKNGYAEIMIEEIKGYQIVVIE